MSEEKNPDRKPDHEPELFSPEYIEGIKEELRQKTEAAELAIAQVAARNTARRLSKHGLHKCGNCQHWRPPVGRGSSGKKGTCWLSPRVPVIKKVVPVGYDHEGYTVETEWEYPPMDKSEVCGQHKALPF